jgi:transposase
MPAARYFDLVREMTDAYNHRLRLVESVRQRGIKPTAQLFATSTLTVRKWWRRYQQQGPSGLKELTRVPHHCPHKASAQIEEQVLALRRKLPTFGAARLKREFDLTVSHMAIQRIWREHGLIRKRRKKYQRKQDLAAVKATWRLFQQISADTKDLCDIPQFWPQAQRLRLPLVEYTAREVRSGLLFWAFAQKRSAAASAVFAARIQQHLDRWGVTLRDLAWQTDNGSEFIGGHDRDGKRTGFPSALGDSRHLRIPPAAHTFQSDVETVHRLVEDEFFDLETFSSRSEFLAKAQTYQLYFNLARPNSHKENQTPWQIIERLAPRSPLELCLLPPVFLDYYLNDSGGYDVPSYPYEGAKLVVTYFGKYLYISMAVSAAPAIAPIHLKAVNVPFAWCTWLSMFSILPACFSEVSFNDLTMCTISAMASNFSPCLLVVASRASTACFIPPMSWWMSKADRSIATAYSG